MRTFFSLSTIASLAAASHIDLNLHDSAHQYLNEYLNVPAHVNRVLNHGCWCPKLDSSADDSLLGGPKALDALDELCKSYFKKRACLTKLTDGSCENDDLSGTYNLDTSGYFCTNAAGCSQDLCEIDREFANNVKIYLDNEVANLGSIGNSTVVNAVNICELPTASNIPKKCEGTAPDVKAVSNEIAVTRKACEGKNLDIVLLVDGSGSMGTSGYRDACDFSENLVSHLDISPTANRVSVMQFSSMSRTYCNFATSLSAVNTCVNNMKNDFMRSGTNTQYALQAVYNEFINNARSDSKKVFMILTDGVSYGGLNVNGISYGDKIQEFATSFGVGVGRGAPQHQINEIATDPDSDHVWMVSDFSDLDTINLVITAAMCSV